MTSSLSRHVGTRKADTSSAGLGGSVHATNSASGFIKAIESGSKHLIIKRFTLRYPEQKLKLTGDGYQF
ncbi:MAG: nuoI, partial [Nitrososphaeraceae archaeon]|nr:nuoI [Nitrososphaeraceae archaeon]